MRSAVTLQSLYFTHTSTPPHHCLVDCHSSDWCGSDRQVMAHFGNALPEKRPKLSAPFDDHMFERIVSRLSLVDKLTIRSMSRQLKACVDQSLAKQEWIVFFGTYGESCDVLNDKHYDNGIDLSRIGSKLNDKNQHLTQLLAKCPQLRRLSLLNNITIDNQMIDCLFSRCPRLDSLSLLDYRCSYRTFDWNQLADTLANRLVSLEIECRMNQHISTKHLSELVSKAVGLRELTIVSPRRHLEQVFDSLGPNVVTLELKDCKPLDFHEMNALVSGNGRRLQKLVIRYQPLVNVVNLCNQNHLFVLICDRLHDLKRLSFNHFSLDPLVLSSVTKLSQLKALNLNFTGLWEPKTAVFYEYRRFDFRAIKQPMKCLTTLSMNYIGIDLYSITMWAAMLPKLRHLCLNTYMMCICPNRRMNCEPCIRQCFARLATIQTLRSIDLSNPNRHICYACLTVLDQIQSVALNVSGARSRAYWAHLWSIVEAMANKRSNGVLSVHFYSIDLEKFYVPKKLPTNLKFTFANN